MHSSTSASDATAFQRALTLLLIGLFLYLAALEVATRTIFPSMSQGKRREVTDYHAALQVRPAADGSKSVLLVGNSLLLEGVDRAKLTASVAPDIDVSVFPIEGTMYLDWYYGLRRFLREGAHPDVLVLCISARQVLSDGTNGERFANSMMSLRDLLQVKRDAHLDSMSASAYFFAHFSAWLSDRSYVRNGLLEKFVPGAKSLVAHFTFSDPAPLAATGDAMEKAMRRLHNLDDLAREHGVRFIWLVPPTLNAEDPAPAIKTAAEREGLSVLIPAAPASLPATMYADGFHMNASGAEVFTGQLATTLRAELMATR